MTPLQGLRLLRFFLLRQLSGAQPAVKIQVGDHRRHLFEAPVQFDPTAKLLGLAGGTL
jgi:hypothetical protein